MTAMTDSRAAETQAQGGGEVVEMDMHKANGLLCDFAMRWTLDGDYLRCKSCKRPQLTSYADHPFPHADGCKRAETSERHPWRTFAALLAPLVPASAPPSAPVGVEGLASALQSMRDRMMTALPPKFGDAFDGDFDTLLEAINAFKAGRGQNLAALAQQPASDGGFTAADMMDARQEGRKEAQQPAAVDGGVIVIDGRRYAVETVRTALLGLAADVARDLAAQPGGSDNDR